VQLPFRLTCHRSGPLPQRVGDPGINSSRSILGSMVGSVKDCHDLRFLRYGCHTFPTWVPYQLPIFREGPWCHELFHHGPVLELVLDRVRVVQIRHFEKFLKMIFGHPSLAIEVMFGSRYTLLNRVVGSLVATAIAGYYGDVMGSPLLPLLAALSAIPSTLDSGLGGCSSATISSCFSVA
jgi:hypothetical protein